MTPPISSPALNCRIATNSIARCARDWHCSQGQREEVGSCHSSCKAGEQDGTIRRGAGRGRLFVLGWFSDYRRLEVIVRFVLVVLVVVIVIVGISRWRHVAHEDQQIEDVAGHLGPRWTAFAGPIITAPSTATGRQMAEMKGPSRGSPAGA